MKSASEFARLLREPAPASPTPTEVGLRHLGPALDPAKLPFQLPEPATLESRDGKKSATGALGLGLQGPSVQITIQIVPTMLLDQLRPNDLDKAADIILPKVSVEFLDKAVALRKQHAIEKGDNYNGVPNHAVSARTPAACHVDGNIINLNQTSHSLRADFLKPNGLLEGTASNIFSSAEYGPSTAKTPCLSSKLVSYDQMTHPNPDKLDNRSGNNTTKAPHYPWRPDIRAVVANRTVPAKHKVRVPTTQRKRRRISYNIPSGPLIPGTISSQGKCAFPAGRWGDHGLSDDEFSSDENERSRPVKLEPK